MLESVPWELVLAHRPCDDPCPLACSTPRLRVAVVPAACPNYSELFGIWRGSSSSGLLYIGPQYESQHAHGLENLVRDRPEAPLWTQRARWRM